MNAAGRLLAIAMVSACAPVVAPDVLGPGTSPQELPRSLPTSSSGSEPIVAVVPPPPAACTAFVRPGVVRRAAVHRVVDEGLGRWLAGGVEVDRILEKTRFRGWAIRRLYAGDPCYAQVDLLPGDVVVRINGKPIEQPTQANEVFQSLRSATNLAVEYVREGRPRRVSLAIAED